MIVPHHNSQAKIVLEMDESYMIWRSIPAFQVQRHLPEAQGLNLHKQIRIGALLLRRSMHVRKQDSEHMLGQDFVHDSHVVVTWHTPGRCLRYTLPEASFSSSFGSLTSAMETLTHLRMQ